MCERARQQLHRPYVAQKSVVCCFSILRQKRLRACRSAKFNLSSGRKTPAPVFTDSGERSLRVAAEKPRSQSRNSPQNKYYATYHFTSAPRVTSYHAHRCADARVWAFSGCGARWRVLDLQLLLSRQPTNISCCTGSDSDDSPHGTWARRNGTGCQRERIQRCESMLSEIQDWFSKCQD